MHLTWQRPGGGGMRSRERRRQCGKEAAARTALKGGELETAAQLWRAVRRRQRGSGGRGVESMDAAARFRRAGRRRQCGSGGRGEGGSAAMEGG